MPKSLIIGIKHLRLHELVLLITIVMRRKLRIYVLDHSSALWFLPKELDDYFNGNVETWSSCVSNIGKKGPSIFRTT